MQGFWWRTASETLSVPNWQLSFWPGLITFTPKPGATWCTLSPPQARLCPICQEIVWPEDAVYPVEVSRRTGRDLVNMAQKRPNVIPIIEDARHPTKYRMLVPMVHVIFADVAQPD